MKALMKQKYSWMWCFFPMEPHSQEQKQDGSKEAFFSYTARL